jgi:hypothetical protein
MAELLDKLLHSESPNFKFVQRIVPALNSSLPAVFDGELSKDAALLRLATSLLRYKENTGTKWYQTCNTDIGKRSLELNRGMITEVEDLLLVEGLPSETIDRILALVFNVSDIQGQVDGSNFIQWSQKRSDLKKLKETNVALFAKHQEFLNQYHSSLRNLIKSQTLILEQGYYLVPQLNLPGLEPLPEVAESKELPANSEQSNICEKILDLIGIKPTSPENTEWGILANRKFLVLQMFLNNAQLDGIVDRASLDRLDLAIENIRVDLYDWWTNKGGKESFKSLNSDFEECKDIDIEKPSEEFYFDKSLLNIPDELKETLKSMNLPDSTIDRLVNMEIKYYDKC